MIVAERYVSVLLTTSLCGRICKYCYLLTPMAVGVRKDAEEEEKKGGVSSTGVFSTAYHGSGHGMRNNSAARMHAPRCSQGPSPSAAQFHHRALLHLSSPTYISVWRLFRVPLNSFSLARRHPHQCVKGLACSTLTLHTPRLAVSRSRPPLLPKPPFLCLPRHCRHHRSSECDPRATETRPD